MLSEPSQSISSDPRDPGCACCREEWAVDVLKRPANHRQDDQAQNQPPYALPCAD
jgi:hypothetical protein